MTSFSAASLLALCAAMLVMWMGLSLPSWRGHVPSQGFHAWIRGAVLMAVGVGLMSRRGVLPDVVTNVVSNGCLLAGVWGFQVGMGLFYGLAAPPRWLGVLLGAAFVALAWLWWCDPSPGAVEGARWRVAAITFAMLVSAVVLALRLMRGVPRPWGFGLRCTLSGLALGAVSHLVRGVAVLSGPIADPVLGSWLGGALALALIVQVQLFTVGLVLTLEARAQAALRVANERLSVDASTDVLTGLPNRRAFESVAAIERTRARRHGGALAVVLVDIDHFKRVNDRWGHPTGDAVLRELGRLCGLGLRGHDLLARWGGEELALLLPHCGALEAERVAGRMLARVRNTPLEALDGEQLTLSAGVAAVRADDVDVGAALARADAALYRAKNAGRDRVEVEEPCADVLAPADPSDARWVPTDDVATPA